MLKNNETCIDKKNKSISHLSVLQVSLTMFVVLQLCVLVAVCSLSVSASQSSSYGERGSDLGLQVFCVWSRTNRRRMWSCLLTAWPPSWACCSRGPTGTLAASCSRASNTRRQVCVCSGFMCSTCALKG